MMTRGYLFISTKGDVVWRARGDKSWDVTVADVDSAPINGTISRKLDESGWDVSPSPHVGLTTDQANYFDGRACCLAVEFWRFIHNQVRN